MDSKNESKNESKDSDYKRDKKEDKGDDESKVVELDVSAIHIPSERDETLLQAPLDVEVVFSLDRDVKDANWIVKLVVDCAMKRQIKILEESTKVNYTAGKNKYNISIEEIDFTGFKKSTLANAGLLMMGFHIKGEEIATVNLIVNVTKNSEGKLAREILNPLL